MPIIGANIIWSDNSGGTTSDMEGNFILSNPDNLKNYIVSYVGYQNDTLSVSSINPKIFLISDTELDEVSLEYNSKSSSVSLLSSANIINIIDQRVFKLTPFFFSYTISKTGLYTLTKTRINSFWNSPKARNYKNV